MRRKVISLCAASLAAAAACSAYWYLKPIGGFEVRFFVSKTGTPAAYRLLRPHSCEPGKRYPLIVFLHGAGGRGRWNRAQLADAVPVFSNLLFRERYKSFVYAPQCPRENDQYWVYIDEKKPRYPERISYPLHLALEGLDDVLARNSVDRSRIYLVGYSMGAEAVWDLLVRCPQRFAAAVPIAGAADPKTAPIICTVPVWYLQGELDPIYPLELTNELIQALRNAGGNPRVTIYKGLGHSTPALFEPGLFPWLFQQTALLSRASQ